jgi:hypothetical protein
MAVTRRPTSTIGFIGLQETNTIVWYTFVQAFRNKNLYNTPTEVDFAACICIKPV